MARVISVVGWKKFQHYKDRDPPWVKLYRDLLTTESWVLGTDLSRLVQVASVLLAARYSNQIPYLWDLIRKVSHLGCSENEFDDAVAHLVSGKFLEIHDVTDALAPSVAACNQHASSVLAKCYSEERREEKSRAEKTRAREAVDTGRPRERDGCDPPPDFLKQLQARYPAGTYREAQWLLGHREALRRLEEGETVEALYGGCDRYRLQCDAKGSTGTQYVMSPAKFFIPEGGGPAPYTDRFPLPPETPTAMDEINAACEMLKGGTPTETGRVFDHEPTEPLRTIARR